jgi:hypothetical protein
MPKYTLSHSVFRNRWETISMIRIYSEQIILEQTNNQTIAKLISSAAAELMENAYKYSVTKGGMIAIEYDTDTKNYILTETNIIDQEHLHNLKNILLLINKDDPVISYKKMMLRSFENNTISQLGLAKIKYECNAAISYKTYNIKNQSYSGLESFISPVNMKDRKIVKIKVISNFSKIIL